MKNALLLLMVYSGLLTVFLVAYFAPVRSSLSRVVGALNFSQRFILVFAISIILVVFISFGLLLWLEIDIEATNLGQVGDFIGGLLNPILSFLALIAIVISISVQERELASSVTALRAQEEVFKIQNFENSFFNLLAMQRIRRAEQKKKNGQELESAYKWITREIQKERAIIDGQNLSKRQAHVMAKEFVNKSLKVDSVNLLLQQYFMIKRLINSARLSDEQAQHYMLLAYSDFSTYESVVLANYAVILRSLLLDLKKYKLVNIKDTFLISPYLHGYYDVGGDN